MLKITFLILIGFIIFFFLRPSIGMAKIDAIYKKETLTDMKKIQLEIQKRLDKNKTNNKK